MISKNLLIIFVKNLIHGEVKTRLAKTVGDMKAMEVYKRLINHTLQISSGLMCEKMVCYSDDIESNDIFNSEFLKLKQQGIDLGERMFNSFKSAFDSGYENVVIIGSDCPELSAEILNDAFFTLGNSDVVIGPAQDGGYYLLGMKKAHSALFTNKSWSSAFVFQQTIEELESLKLTYCSLPVLSDLDDEKDLNALNHLI